MRTESYPSDVTDEQCRRISVAPLLADAIRRIHGNESISDLFRDEPPAEKK